MRNNLFEYATSELSQDAVICWAINWFNDGRKPELQKMARNILYALTGLTEIKKVDDYRQFNKIDFRKFD